MTTKEEKGLSGQDNDYINSSVEVEQFAERAKELRPKYANDPYALAQLEHYDKTSELANLISGGIQAVMGHDLELAITIQNEDYQLAKGKFNLSDEELIELQLGPASAYEF